MTTMVDNRGQFSTKPTAEENRSDDDNYIKEGNSPTTIHPTQEEVVDVIGGKKIRYR